MRPVYDGHQRAGRPGQHRGRPAAGAPHRRHHRRGARAVVAGRPAQRDDQDPGHPGGARRDHRGHLRGHQRQRHVDLQPRALQGGDGRLPDRPGAGALQGRRPVDHPLGRVVLRQPDRHRGRQADRHSSTRDSASRRPSRCAARPPSPTRGWPTGSSSGSSPASAGRRSAERRCPQAASALGVDLDEGPEPPRHHVRHRAGRPRHRQHDAGGHHRGDRRPRRDRRPTRSRPTTTTRRSPRPAGEVSASRTTTWSKVVEDEGVDKFEKSWQELLDTVKTALEGAKA